MGAKRIFCTVFYIIFSLIFTAVLICNVTGILNQLGIIQNTFITTTINTNLLNPIHTAIDSLGFLDSVMALNIVCIVMTVLTMIFWILSVSNLTNVLRGASARGTGLTTIIFSIVMFAVLGATIVLLVRNGEAIANVLANYYLIGQLVVYLLTLLVAIFAMSISPLDEIENSSESETTEPAPMTAQQREDRVKQILNNEIDPRV